jgi:hypothetical protein
MGKILVLYVFHIFNERVAYFIKNALFEDENVDFIMISNDKNYRFNVPRYVKTFHRENIGFDFGGWSEALLKDNLYKSYDAFIFVNSSVVGPFLPAGFTGKWTDVYLRELKDNIKLYGSTINTCKDPLHKAHVQSYIFAMKKETLEYLIQCEIFSTTNYAPTFHDAIWKKEVLMSRKLIEKGWNIGSSLRIYRGVDFTFKTKPLSKYPRNTFNYDSLFLKKYMDIFWTKEELVFVKGNRDCKFI